MFRVGLKLRTAHGAYLSFELNNALLSRARTYLLKSLSVENLETLIVRAINTDVSLTSYDVQISPDLINILAKSAQGDARRCLNLLELSVDLGVNVDTGQCVIDRDVISEVIQGSLKRFV